MDPDQVLEEIKRLLAQTPDDAIRMAYNWGKLQAHFEALNDWLTMGGYIPNDWKNAGQR